MEKYSLILDDEFIQYCKLNDIKDIEKFAKETFNKGFLQLKYGWAPHIPLNQVDKHLDEVNEKIGKNGLVGNTHHIIQKEDITDTQIKSNVDIPLKEQSRPESPQKELYDE